MAGPRRGDDPNPATDPSVSLMGRGRGTRALAGLVTVVLCAGVASAVALEPEPSPTAEAAARLAAPPLPRSATEPLPAPTSSSSTSSTTTTTTEALAPRPDVSPYDGLGAWVDAFDYGPAYHRPRQGPLLVADDIDAMAARGVTTLYLQAARLDDRSPEGIVDRALVAGLLKRAHEQGMRVVGWYLPKFAELEADLANLLLIRDFQVDGHRFDGIAVDIEYRRDVPDHAERNRRLVELSRRLRAEAGDHALGAIVYPPVLFEEIRPDFWPGFPWRELAESYDVWLPMVYWTEIAAESPSYDDGYHYTEAGTRRLLANLDDPAARVHPVGGVADTATVEDVEGFVRAAGEVGAVGYSMYDYRTTSPAGWQVLATNGTGAAETQ
jgi:hypothetical protein